MKYGGSVPGNGTWRHGQICLDIRGNLAALLHSNAIRIVVNFN